MNAAVISPRIAPDVRSEQAGIALLGTGRVGSALLSRLASCQRRAFGERLSLRYVANSRFSSQPSSTAPWSIADVAARMACGESAAGIDTPSLNAVSQALGDRGLRIVIDATASEAVTERHAQWLAQGIHVVTACKIGQGTSLTRWRQIQSACRDGGSTYGDSATVGAGLPLLKSIRGLQAGGDRIHAIAGVLSGSLAWLFNHYDGKRRFSALVREACQAGYTEPDPRDDLSGEDVRRKLLILARSAGDALENDQVSVASLLTPAMRQGNDDGWVSLDAPLFERFAAANARGETLRFVARLENGEARVGIESLSREHLLVGGAGTDNRIAIWSDRYREQPLVIQGPGAGAEVTAAALLDDVLEIVSATARRW